MSHPVSGFVSLVWHGSMYGLDLLATVLHSDAPYVQPVCCKTSGA